MHLDLALLYLDAEESSFPTPQTIMHLDLALLYPVSYTHLRAHET